MKLATRVVIVLFLSWTPTLAQVDTPGKSNPAYDSLLAHRTGADEYGMKHYVMAFLKAGPTRIQDSVKREEIQRKHLRNIKRLAEEGTLLLAGPFLDNQPLRGIIIFNVATVEEASVLARTDPAVKAGVLIFELHPWYGSAALMEVPKIHKTLEQTDITK